MHMERAANDKMQVYGPKRCGSRKPRPPGTKYQWDPILGNRLVYGLFWKLRTVVCAKILLRSDFPKGMCPHGWVESWRTSRSSIPNERLRGRGYLSALV